MRSGSAGSLALVVRADSEGSGSEVSVRTAQWIAAILVILAVALAVEALVPGAAAWTALAVCVLAAIALVGLLLLLHGNGDRLERRRGEDRSEFKLALMVVAAALARVVQARAPGPVSTAVAVGAVVVLALVGIAFRAAEWR
jgi:membrane protein YdbS with pleckstrin-like domain